MPFRHDDPARTRLAVELSASVETLPKKSCMCERPAWAGNTIGSFGARWDTSHLTDQTA
jgi:hypothetical protein